MPYLVLGIAVVVGLVLVVRGFSGMDPNRRALAMRVAAGVVAVLVLAVVALERGVGTLLAAILFALPLALRWRGFARWLKSLRGPTPGQRSGVETRYLRMTLDHDTGVLDGTVLAGRFRGRRLAELSSAELLELLHECRVEDEESARVLEAYLDRTYGSEWRGAEAAGASGGGKGGERRHSPWTGASGMTREEACEILGVRTDASADEIKAAHRRLMLRVHPDQGGSDYLAAKINQAKDVLLGGKG